MPDEPYSQADHDEAAAIGGCVLLVATIAFVVTIALVVGACQVIAI